MNRKPKSLKFIILIKYIQLFFTCLTIAYFFYSGINGPINEWETGFREGVWGTLGYDHQYLLTPYNLGSFTVLAGLPLIIVFLALFFIRRRKLLGLQITLGFEILASFSGVIKVIIPIISFALSFTKNIKEYMTSEETLKSVAANNE